MINLLPKETKSAIRAARTNVILRRYLVFLTSSALFMIAIFGAGYYLTTNDRMNAKKELAQLEEKMAAHNPEKKRAEEFEKNLSISQDILKSEIAYSDLIVDIAQALPPGTILTSLNISTDSFDTPSSINARTCDEEGGLRLKDALSKSDRFKDVSIQSILSPDNSRPGTDQTGRNSTNCNSYPYTVVLLATIVKPVTDKASAANTGSARP